MNELFVRLFRFRVFFFFLKNDMYIAGNGLKFDIINSSIVFRIN